MRIEDIENGIRELASLPVSERIEALNRLSQVIGEVHPNTDPVSSVRWVPADKVVGNPWNPNTVMPPEMQLLYISIKEDGYTQPIVVYWDQEQQLYIVVDGFHRNRIGKEYRDIRERTHGYLPVVVIDKSLAERMASTVRHNRARGKHAVLGMVDIVVKLANEEGVSETNIRKQLGMDADEVLRLTRTTGIPTLFKNRDYSRSWKLKEDADGIVDGEEQEDDFVWRT